MILINKTKLNDLKTIIEKIEELNTILSEYAPYITRARELGVIEESQVACETHDHNASHFSREVHSRDASHCVYETHKEGASQSACETHGQSASHIANEPHSKSASQPEGETHAFDASQSFIETQPTIASQIESESHLRAASHLLHETHRTCAPPYTSLRPKTNPRAEIRVFEEDGKARLEWWIAGRKTEEAVIPDAWDTFYAMQSMADWNTGILTFSKFWKNVKRINGMNTNRASLIFNFIGVDPRFDCEMEKTTKTMSTGIKIRDWAIIFNTESKPKFTAEQARRYWSDLLG